mmetsp:Transcript_14896/g.24745  ORF Transcript_14896/g.24745 Transcript_14896/m.24745 type:complete len:137 (+) Transcript_14896:79-489(+)
MGAQQSNDTEYNLTTVKKLISERMDGERPWTTDQEIRFIELTRKVGRKSLTWEELKEHFPSFFAQKRAVQIVRVKTLKDLRRKSVQFSESTKSTSARRSEKIRKEQEEAAIRSLGTRRKAPTFKQSRNNRVVQQAC